MKRSICGLALLCLLLVRLALPAFAAEPLDPMAETAAWLKAAGEPGYGSEWVLLGLARAGAVDAAMAADYYDSLSAAVAQRDGVLSTTKYTEYSRVILALTAMGRDPRSVAGYDLTVPLGDYQRVLRQGLNGPIWALIALDAGGYPMPQPPGAATQATREMYVELILSRQHEDGGWSLSVGGSSDPDVTAMALDALAGYRDSGAVSAAVERALGWLSENQTDDGAYISDNNPNAESTAQVLTALCALGIDPGDPRFVKNGAGVEAALLSFRNDDGSFCHIRGEGANGMATEQAFYALTALARARAGQSPLFQMDDVTPAGAGLPGKHPDVTASRVTVPGATFPDVAEHPHRRAMEALAARGIINGVGDGRFEPDRTMTRAEFAAIVVRALGLPLGTGTDYSDVAPDQWFAPYIGAASRYGIVKGVGGGRFDPMGTISRQEAAVMVVRAAGLCGMDTALDSETVQGTLDRFSDGDRAASWAGSAMAFCHLEGLFTYTGQLLPEQPILRWEIAQMLWDLLEKTALT